MGATLPSGQVACEIREIIYCVIGCDCVPVFLVLCMAVVAYVAVYLVCVCVFLCVCIYVFLCVYVCPCGCYHLRAGGRTIFTRAKESGGTTATWRIS